MSARCERVERVDRAYKAIAFPSDLANLSEGSASWRVGGQRVGFPPEELRVTGLGYL